MNTEPVQMTEQAAKDEPLDMLSRIPVFSSLPKGEQRNIAQNLTTESYARDFILTVQNQTIIDHIYIIKHGRIEIYFEAQGQKSQPILLNPGEIFGGISILMNGGISLRTARVEEDVTLYVFSQELFIDLCARYDDFYKYFIDTFRNRMNDRTYAEAVTSSQAFQFLKGVIPFSFLPEEEIRQIASRVSTVHYPEDTILLVQGRSLVEYLYIIQKGGVERYYEEGGEKNLSGVLGEGDIHGGISMLINNGVSIRTIKTIEDSWFYILPKIIFLDICERFSAFQEYFTDTFGRRMLDRTYASIITRTLQPKVESMRFFNQPLSNIYTPDPVTCDENTTIQMAAALMNQHRCSSIFVQGAEGRVIGVVTDSDLRNKVISKGYDIQKPVADIMTSPVKMIQSEALIFEGLMIMLQENVKHLAVIDADTRVVGVVSNSDLLNAQGQSPFFLIREISAARTQSDIIKKHEQLPGIIKNLIQSGAKAKNINKLITTISDAILDKLIGFALDEMGPPPVRFVFMILGSEGRKEQTLKTDQDNAIIFEDVPRESEAGVQEYFLKFAEKVCAWLDEAGFCFCEGGIMAKNPKWCQPLSIWKQYFRSWILEAEPENLLQASIFFDFRGAFGDMEIIERLRGYLFDSVGGWSGFLRHLTENALYFKPPIGFFRNFVVESRGEHRNKFDIKSAMMPIVDFARIYALKNKIAETNTLERLYQLYMKKVLPWKDYSDIEQAYSFLMQARFMRQISAVMDEKARPDNYINPKKLSRIEQTMLKEIFKRIEKLQTKLGFEFTGVM